MKQNILTKLKEKYTSSDGHCGIQLVQFNIPFKALKPILNELYKSGLISVHDHHKGKLIKLKK